MPRLPPRRVLAFHGAGLLALAVGCARAAPGPPGGALGASSLSGLAVDPVDDGRALSVPDGRVAPSRVLTLDTRVVPPAVLGEVLLRDARGALRGELERLRAELPAAAVEDLDVAALVAEDGTLALDLEGVAVAPDGTLWLVSEGHGDYAAERGSLESPNLLLHAAADGTILAAHALPRALLEVQRDHGLEGVAVEGELVYVAFQQPVEAAGDRDGMAGARIGRYDAGVGTWGFARWPLEELAEGRLVLGGLVSLGGGELAALERSIGADPPVHRIRRASTVGLAFRAPGAAGDLPLLAPRLAVDLMATGAWAPFGDRPPARPEGLARRSDGTALVVTDDNGGEDGGETVLLVLPGALP